jgi:amino acid adenylation domain-containing protein
MPTLDFIQKAQSFATILQQRAASAPSQVAFRFITDGEESTAEITYASLFRKASAVAEVLRERSSVNKPVLLLYPPGISYIVGFFGCILAKAIAVPAYPPANARRLSRLQAIISDAGARVALTCSATSGRWQAALTDPLDRNGCTLLSLDETAEAAISDELPAISSDQIAFLQYTSGSTGIPKGVIIRHASLLANSAHLSRAFQYGPESHCFSWLPPYHDMGLIGGILQPVYGGFPCTMMSPAAFLQSPVRWLENISRYRITLSGGPNFAYDLCCRKITTQQKLSISLDSWEVAFNGAEPVRAETLKNFVREFSNCGFQAKAFMPCYGLAEATLFVSGARKGAGATLCALDTSSLARGEVQAGSDDTTTLVGCGRPEPEQHITIVDPHTRQRRESGIGEIWISSASCASGYWNRPDETREVFKACLSDSGEGPFLRTGDLGFVQDGDLFIAGRCKDLIIIRGLNYYAHDLEETVASYDSRLRPGCGAAFSIELASEERLIIVHEVERNTTEMEQIVRSISSALAEGHDLQVHAVVLLPPGALPKTSSGKVRRGECRRAFLAGELTALASWKRSVNPPEIAPAPKPFAEIVELERWLTEQLAVQVGIPPESIDPAQPMNRYGLDSLHAANLSHVIQDTTGQSLEIAKFLEGTTLHMISTELWYSRESGLGTDADLCSPASCRDLPLSSAQKALWLLHALTPGDTGLNVTAAFQVSGGIDPRALERALQHLVNRHTALRTTYYVRDDVYQCVHEHLTATFEHTNVSQWPFEAIHRVLTESGHRRFDIERECPVRLALFEGASDQSWLVISAHHIAADYVSMTILFRELAAIYASETTGAPLTLTGPRSHMDFVHAERKFLATDRARELEHFWLRQQELTPQLLNLPLDEPHPAVPAFSGASHGFRIAPELASASRHFAAKHGVTLNTLLLAAYSALLSRYSGQDVFGICTPVATRTRSEFARIVGYLVNPAVVRADLSGNVTFADLVQRTHEHILALLRAADFPYTNNSHSGSARQKSAPVMFTLHTSVEQSDGATVRLALGEGGVIMDFAGLKLETLALQRRMAQFDLALIMADADGELWGSLEYNSDIFKSETVARMASVFVNLLEAALSDPGLPVSRLNMMTIEQRLEVLACNETETFFVEPHVLHHLVEDQVSRTPTAPAVIFGSRTLTYGELDGYANALAAQIQALGIETGDLVGIYMERSLEMVISLLAVLKAGGTYLPLDPEFPDSRLQYVLADAKPSLVLTQAGKPLLCSSPLAPYQFVVILDDKTPRARSPHSKTAELMPAYIIYTSGSTGFPKGAINTHRGICNRLIWMQSQYQLTRSDRVIQKTPFTFDVSVWEFFWPLIAGATLVVVPPGLHRDPFNLARFIQKWEVSTIHFVPSMLRLFLAEPEAAACTSLQRIICSGEALSVGLQNLCHDTLDAELHNLYGPTEVAVDATYWPCVRDSKSRVVPIGRPIANLKTYILSPDRQLLPVGFQGELYLGGMGVGLGYLNRPALTSERFVPDPFSQVPGQRMYRTGDIARQRNDGNIEYLGRTDSQIKLRGCRIELGELEAACEAHPAIREAVVMQRQDNQYEPYLAAYVVPRLDQTIDPQEILQYLRTELPDYMVPSFVTVLDSLPVNHNGKLDYSALPSPVNMNVPSSYVAPRSPVETELCRIWQETLNSKQVGICDNFRDLGGHSLLLIRLAGQIRERFQVDIPLQILMDTPTVAAMTDAILLAQLEEQGEHFEHIVDEALSVELGLD